jgi:hypothetical protein
MRAQRERTLQACATRPAQPRRARARLPSVRTRLARGGARLEFSSAARGAAWRALAAAGPQRDCAQIYRAKTAEAVVRARSHSPPAVWRLPRRHKRCALRFSAQACGGGAGEALRAVTSAHGGVRATLRRVARFAGLEDFRASLSLASRMLGADANKYCHDEATSKTPPARHGAQQ